MMWHPQNPLACQNLTCQNGLVLSESDKGRVFPPRLLNPAQAIDPRSLVRPIASIHWIIGVQIAAQFTGCTVYFVAQLSCHSAYLLFHISNRKTKGIQSPLNPIQRSGGLASLGNYYTIYLCYKRLIIFSILTSDRCLMSLHSLSKLSNTRRSFTRRILQN